MNLVKKNIFILVFIQGINYLFPLLTIPFLSRVFGPEGIGALTLAQAIILYLGFIVDFGFGLTVTRKISLAEKNKDQNQIKNNCKQNSPGLLLVGGTRCFKQAMD